MCGQWEGTMTLWWCPTQDLSNLYDQYRSIEPWLQRKDKSLSDKELYQSIEDRKKLVSENQCHCVLHRTEHNYFSVRFVLPDPLTLKGPLNHSIFAHTHTTRPCRMVSTSVSCVSAAARRALPTGGTQRSTLDLLYSCRPTGG